MNLNDMSPDEATIYELRNQLTMANLQLSEAQFTLQNLEDMSRIAYSGTKSTGRILILEWKSGTLVDAVRRGKARAG